MRSNNTSSYVYIWYGTNQGVFYILRQSKKNWSYQTRIAAILDAERESIDIPDCHGGPFLQVLMIPAYATKEDHLKKFGEMLVKQLSTEHCHLS